MGEQTYPEPTVGVFIFNPEGKLLLLQSHKWPGKYVVPGGHVDLGERIEEAARREAREETSLDVYDLRLLCWQEFVYDPAFWKPRHFIFFDFACRTESSEVVLNDEAEMFLWIEPQKVFDLPIDEYTRRAMIEYLTPR